MLPFMLGEKKRTIGAIIGESMKESEGPDKSEMLDRKMIQLEQKEASMNLIQAIEKKDSTMARMALKMFFVACYKEHEMSEDEGD
jgi:hypothetical protein